MNIQALMKQAQSMQKDMLKAKEEIDKTVFEGKNGIVTVEVMGSKVIKKITIENKETLENDELEMLEDMLVVAINDAFSKIDSMTEQKMGKYTNSMPGLF